MAKTTKKIKIIYPKIRKKILAFFGFFYKEYLLGKKPGNVILIEPDYYIINSLNNNSTVVDVGTGDSADLSLDLIEKFGVKSYGFDPTRKHYDKLKNIEKESNGNFTIFNYALSHKTGEAEFNESVDNVSGSFSVDHVNVKRDNINKYMVKMITPIEIFSKINVSKVNLLKIDVEGEEYKIIASLTKDLAEKVDQIIFEFHHHCIDKYCIMDTVESLKKMQTLGFDFYSADGINYLFYKKHGSN